MTDFTYTVINRPKKDSAGRTNISWGAECGRDEVPLGGYLVTSRTAKGESRNYQAFMIKQDADGNDTETLIGDGFETRAKAAFAIWRKYYADWRDQRAQQKAAAEAEKQRRRDERASRKAFRATPEGKKAYQDELNRKARERRAAMTPADRKAEADARRAKREASTTVAAVTE